MRHEIELAYLGIEVPDPVALTPFFQEVIGLAPGEPTASGAVRWRNDAKVQRLVIEPGERNDAVYLGIEMETPAGSPV